MQRKSLLSILLIFFFYLQTSLLFSQVIYVDANVPGGIQDGTSWANAFADLQDALAIAQYGDTVWVAQGAYYPTGDDNRNVSFELPNGVALFGGFTGVEAALDERDWETNETILSGGIGTPGDDSDNSFTVVYIEYADSSTVLDGFVIISGNANSQVPLEPAGSSTKNGGGMYIDGSAQAADTRPVIQNCTFRLNNARFRGGAVYINSVQGGSASPRFHACHFEENTASLGGALYKDGGSFDQDMLVTDCAFWANLANQGGAVNYLNSHGERNFVFRDCLFQDNYALTGGGAVHQDVNHPQGKLIFTDCDFVFNATEGDGGAIEHYNFAGSDALFIDSCKFITNYSGSGTIFIFGGHIEIEDSIFDSNVAINGGVFLEVTAGDLTVTNCICKNSTSEDSGIIRISSENSEVTFIGCTFFSNHSPEGIIINHSSSLELNIINSIIWGNDLNSNGQLISNNQANLSVFTLSHTLVDVPDCASIGNGDVTCGPGMLYLQDPLFTDTAAGDFTLLPCSPAINAGDNAIVDSLGILTDLAGNPRILGGTVDMGAYESPAFVILEASVLQPSCGGTANGAVQFQLAHGCGPFSFAWTSGANSGAGTSGLPPGAYSFTVTDALGKEAVKEIEIPEVPAVAATAAAQPYDCTNTAGGTASIMPTGGTAPFNYLWSNADTTAAIASLLPGSYAVTVTGANGCTLTDTVAVEITGHLTLSIDVSPTHCSDSNDGTAAITPLNGTAPFGWLWQDDQTDSLLTGLGGGSYSVTVTDAIGCTDALQFSMTAPDTLVAEATGTDVLCAGQSTGTATATATGGTPIAIGAYTYHWSNAMTTPAIGPLPSGTYAVTVSDGNGCSDTASVFIASPPPLNLTVEATAVLCFGEHDGTAAALASGGTPIAIGAYTYHWSNADTTAAIVNLPPGSYAVTVTDAHDCTQAAQAQIDSSTQIQALFQITHATAAATADGGVEVSLVFGGTPGYSFLWSNGALTQSLQGVLPGSYTLTVTDADSCQSVFYFTVDVANAAGEEAANPFGAVIVPNPSGAGGAELWLELARPQVLTVEVYDGLGRVVFSKKAFTAAGESRRDLPPGMPPGVYWVVVKNGDGAARVLAWAVE